jgi:hypothetical protein
MLLPLFGQGIVSTVDNFGVMGDRPSHPELLDYLAGQFLRDGWSIKKLLRTIVLSRAYRLASEAPENYREIDPANRLVWRHSPRRLEAEELRDAMLATAGRLELKPLYGSPAKALRMIEMPDNGPESRTINEAADRSVSRSVYLPLLRGVTPKSLEAFDPVTQTLVTGQRDATTVPTQALFLLNAAFVRRQSLSLAEKLLSEQDQDDVNKIRQAYRLTLGRTPNQQEVLRSRRFLADYRTTYAKLPPAEQPVAMPLDREKSAKAAPPAIPVDPDNIDRTDLVAVEEAVQPKDPKSAAWMSLVQALYASAEFRFVR